MGLICAYPLHKNSSANKGKALNCCLAEKLFRFSFLTWEGGTEALHYLKKPINYTF